MAGRRPLVVSGSYTHGGIMSLPGGSSVRGSVVAVLGALAVSVAGYSAPASASPASAPQQPQPPGAVSPTPVAGTPELQPATSGKDQIRQLVQCGSMMYAVGSFTTIVQGSTTYTRNGVFSFSATAPYTVSGLKVDVNGEVNSIAFTKHRGCADAYIGGSFTSVHGTTADNIAEVSTSTGAVVTGFGRDANGTVETLLGYGEHLLAGGFFTRVNGYGRDYYASLSPATGVDDGFIKLRVSGHVTGNPAEIYNQQLSNGGNLLLVEGNFTSVGGQPRQQIFMANLSGSEATVTGWTSPEFSQDCVANEAFYVRSAAWSPSNSTVYIATTGYHPLNWASGTFPLYGLCDAAAAFPATQTSVSDLWINYTGCDSYFSVAADDGAVYVAGHPRWSQNQNGCNNAGPGAIADPGLQGLDPGTGGLELRPGSTPVYSMSRANADDMLITSAGLWIASSNRYGSQYCGQLPGHSGICLLPYPPG
jgi:hypothetical protein